ncbi:hypothetical protein EVAR_60272_1 [Eumeta japonica]|uniref:Uncharacterized protein n=1 Tax=Eumeta variegata TaxID=151549 RepID=A0A4C1ZBY6_EUMVA|nr:hypothetical protein EVAR_60272_1 [Eumeta japonica]
MHVTGHRLRPRVSTDICYRRARFIHPGRDADRDRVSIATQASVQGVTFCKRTEQRAETDEVSDTCSYREKVSMQLTNHAFETRRGKRGFI